MRFLAVFLFLFIATPQVPRTWEKTAVDAMELPLANPKFSPVHIDEADYYRIPERVLYKSYPVYAPGREPAGYMERLKTLEPEVAFDPSTLQTEAQWAAAGEVVFNAPTSLHPLFFTAQDLSDPAAFSQMHMPVAQDGTVPFARWVVRKKGVVELGSMSCANCHTRVLDDGTVVPGAQGNNPNDRQGAQLLRKSAAAFGQEKMLAQVRGFARQFESPWIPGDINRLPNSMTIDQLAIAGEQIPPGVTARANTSILLPPQIPDLIGVRTRRYLDHTGLVHHRGIGDMMRYIALAQDVFPADRYGSATAPNSTSSNSAAPEARYSDPQLYALASYLYSLRPPANPNRFDAHAAHGKILFAKLECDSCHTPPLYTNNMLVAVEGFEPPPGAPDVVQARIGVDPRYTLETHKGTGYYKVPSLKGVWYRGPFGHNGSAATLEDWFDPSRLRPDYVPTGFKGFDGKTRSIPGHPFGLALSPSDRADLIAFLKTL